MVIHPPALPGRHSRTPVCLHSNRDLRPRKLRTHVLVSSSKGPERGSDSGDESRNPDVLTSGRRTVGALAKDDSFIGLLVVAVGAGLVVSARQLLNVFGIQTPTSGKRPGRHASALPSGASAASAADRKLPSKSASVVKLSNRARPLLVVPKETTGNVSRAALSPAQASDVPKTPVLLQERPVLHQQHQQRLRCPHLVAPSGPLQTEHSRAATTPCQQGAQCQAGHRRARKRLEVQMCRLQGQRLEVCVSSIATRVYQARRRAGKCMRAGEGLQHEGEGAGRKLVTRCSVQTRRVVQHSRAPRTLWRLLRRGQERACPRGLLERGAWSRWGIQRWLQPPGPCPLHPVPSVARRVLGAGPAACPQPQQLPLAQLPLAQLPLAQLHAPPPSPTLEPHGPASPATPARWEVRGRLCRVRRLLRPHAVLAPHLACLQVLVMPVGTGSSPPSACPTEQ
jgi:hypothetical protein